MSPLDGTVWDSVSRPRFLISGWPLRVWAFLIGGVAWGVLVTGGLFLPPLLAALGLWPLALAALVLLLTVLPLARRALLRAERARVALVDRHPLPMTSPLERAGSPAARHGRLRDRMMWRELGYLVAAALLAVLTGLVPVLLLGFALLLVAAPIVVWAVAPDTVMLIPGRPVRDPLQALPAALVGALAAAIATYVGALLSGVQVQLARTLLTPRDRDLDTRVVELTRTQVRLADAFAAERRRIERDLHDGAQQQLVVLTMTLGLAELELGQLDESAGVGEARRLVVRAKGEATQALRQLRDLVQGVHDQVLEDHGLPVALAELAARSTIPVSTDVSVPERLGAPVENAAYFTVAEALANAAKHAGATTVAITARLWTIEDRRTLVLEITDNGSGGAELTAGAGLQGLADRLAVLSGRLLVTSPRGGPTTIRAEIPCQA